MDQRTRLGGSREEEEEDEEEEEPGDEGFNEEEEGESPVLEEGDKEFDDSYWKGVDCGEKGADGDEEDDDDDEVCEDEGSLLKMAEVESSRLVPPALNAPSLKHYTLLMFKSIIQKCHNLTVVSK